MKITQSFFFEAAHRLPNVPSTHKCDRMHGHSYRIDLTLDGPVDPQTGFVVDFFEIESAIGPLIEQLDHHTLNDVENLTNPTAENIAVWIYDRVRRTMLLLSSVRVYETPNCYAEYEGV